MLGLVADADAGHADDGDDDWHITVHITITPQKTWQKGGWEWFTIKGKYFKWKCNTKKPNEKQYDH